MILNHTLLFYMKAGQQFYCHLRDHSINKYAR